MVMETAVAGVVARSFTIVGFAGPVSAPGSTLQVVQNGGGTPQDTTTGATATVSVTDSLSVSGAFDISGNALARKDGQPWQSLGFKVAQTVTIAGFGVRQITDFDNSPTYGPGTVLKFSGPSIDATGNAISIVALDLANESFNVATDASGATRGAGSWSGAGFAIGQPVVLSGIDGLRRITGFANGGLTLVVDGLPLPTRTGVTVGQVRIGGDTIIVTGGGRTTPPGGPHPPPAPFRPPPPDGPPDAGRSARPSPA